ncbi:MAG TPA: hydrolase [Gemmatimonadaceae bacterium]|jgi:nicotinamidase-related amidase
MDDLELDLATTALVVIDLQKGIVNGPTVPYAAADVVANTVQLAEAFRRKKALVVLVRVDAGPNGELLLRTITDVPRPATQRPPDWIEIVPELGPKAGDVLVTKHQPSAFFGTDLEIQLRRRGIHTIVLTGIATNLGVESTARTGFEHGFNLIFASDAITGRDAELHAMAMSKFFPTIGRVRTTAEIVGAVG